MTTKVSWWLFTYWLVGWLQRNKKSNWNLWIRFHSRSSWPLFPLIFVLLRALFLSASVSVSAASRFCSDSLMAYSICCSSVIALKSSTGDWGVDMDKACWNMASSLSGMVAWGVGVSSPLAAAARRASSSCRYRCSSMDTRRAWTRSIGPSSLYPFTIQTVDCWTFLWKSRCQAANGIDCLSFRQSEVKWSKTHFAAYNVVISFTLEPGVSIRFQVSGWSRYNSQLFPSHVCL